MVHPYDGNIVGRTHRFLYLKLSSGKKAMLVMKKNNNKKCGVAGN